MPSVFVSRRIRVVAVHEAGKGEPQREPLPDIPAERFVHPEFLDVSREEFGQVAIRPRDLRQAEIQILVASPAAPKPILL